jgi:glycosyltransferase involved in cell wall biosynthesis
MRVLYFSRDYTPHDHRFLTALADSEHEVFYLRLERRGHQQESRLLPPGVTVVPWAGGQSPYRRQDNRRLLRSLKEVLRQVQPDIIHAGPVQTAAWLAAKTGFKPLVTMSWGSDLLVDAERDHRMYQQTDFTLAHTSVLVGDCEAVRLKAVSFGFNFDQVVTFPWGVDLELFNPTGDDHGLRQRAGWEDEFVVLHLRSWEPIYGVDVFARAFAQAARQRAELGAR